jgi:hypothetical protein
VLERFKNRSTTADDGATATTVDGDRDRVTTADERPVTTADVPPEERTAAHPRGTVTRETMHRVRERQREEYGGTNWGAAFFGWLVAVGVAVLLTGILAAAGAAIGLTETTSHAADNASPCSPSPTTAAATSPGACRASTAPARASACGRSAC